MIKRYEIRNPIIRCVIIMQAFLIALFRDIHKFRWGYFIKQEFFFLKFKTTLVILKKRQKEEIVFRLF